MMLMAAMMPGSMAPLHRLEPSVWQAPCTARGSDRLLGQRPPDPARQRRDLALELVANAGTLLEDVRSGAIFPDRPAGSSGALESGCAMGTPLRSAARQWTQSRPQEEKANARVVRKLTPTVFQGGNALALVADLEVADAVEVEPSNTVGEAVVANVAGKALAALAGDLGQRVAGLVLLELAGAVVQAEVDGHVGGAGPDGLVAVAGVLGLVARVPGLLLVLHLQRELVAAGAVALQVLLAGLQGVHRLVAGSGGAVGELDAGHIVDAVSLDASLLHESGDPAGLGPDSVAGTVDFTRGHDSRRSGQGQGEDGDDLGGVHCGPSYTFDLPLHDYQ
ncbi:hypothetical protein PG997_002788 [Apiospora hydei]|uniref:Uncharacterized protein n=1 Tax=Apiospora hydei TaxID=1337664 RepID=A0ABR1WXL2_9PEZI